MTFSAASLRPTFSASLPNPGNTRRPAVASAVTFGGADLFTGSIEPPGEILPVLNDGAVPKELREAVTTALKEFAFPLIQDALREEGWKVVFAEFPDQYPGKLTRENALEKTITVPVLAQGEEWLIPESLTCLYEGLAEAVDTSLGKRKPSIWGVLGNDKAYVRQPLSTSEGFRRAVEKDCDGLTMVEKVLHRNDRLHDVFRQELADLFQYGLPVSDFLDGQELLSLAAALNGGETLPPTRFPHARLYLTNALKADWFLKSWVARPFE